MEANKGFSVQTWVKCCKLHTLCRQNLKRYNAFSSVFKDVKISRLAFNYMFLNWYHLYHLVSFDSVGIICTIICHDDAPVHKVFIGLQLP